MGRLLSPSSAASRRTSTKLEKAVRVKLCVRMKPTRSFARGCGDRALARSGLAIGRMAHFSRSMTDFYSNARMGGLSFPNPEGPGAHIDDGICARIQAERGFGRSADFVSRSHNTVGGILLSEAAGPEHGGMGRTKMTGFSIFNLAAHAARRHLGWPQQWRSPDPKPAYDVIIIGGGGHGLGTAYYLAKEHGIRNVALLEKGWIGGGNTGRNTTIIRSNYLFEESAAIYDHALKLWEGLSQDLNYNVMFSPRGVMMLAHTVHDVQVFKRHVHANRLCGVDNEWLTAEQAKAFCPPLNISKDTRYPVIGAALQRRGGIARHDAVAWGYARGADRLGVDIIQNCEVTGIRRGADGAVVGVETTRGFIRAGKIGVVAAGNT